MPRTWTRESTPAWNEDKKRIIGGAPSGAFDLSKLNQDGPMSGEWWRADEDGKTVGFAWMDVVWGDAEILLAVAPECQKQGVGAYLLSKLTREAAARGLRRMYNTVRAENQEAEAVTRWLLSHGFARSHGSNLLERPVPS